jgi:DNA polymerase-1
MKQEKKVLYLLDAMSLLYRAHFVFIRNPRINSKGMNTSALYGFMNSILDVILNKKPTHLAVVYDTAAPTHRHVLFSEYKAQRQEIPEDIAQAIPLSQDLCNALNIPVILKDGYEADDIIATLALQAAKDHYTV